MVIPGSHKSNFPHPNAGDYSRGDRMDHLEGAVPAYLNKGDALLFVDGLMHGGSSRTNPGERRVTIYRYGPAGMITYTQWLNEGGTLEADLTVTKLDEETFWVVASATLTRRPPKG